MVSFLRRSSGNPDTTLNHGSSPDVDTGWQLRTLPPYLWRGEPSDLHLSATGLGRAAAINLLTKSGSEDKREFGMLARLKKIVRCNDAEGQQGSPRRQTVANPILEMIRAGKRYLPRRVPKIPAYKQSAGDIPYHVLERLRKQSADKFARSLTPEVADRVLRENIEDAMNAASRTEYGTGARAHAEVIELDAGPSRYPDFDPARRQGGASIVSKNLIRDPEAIKAFESWKQRKLGGMPFRNYTDEDLGRLLGMSELGLRKRWKPKTGIELDIADEFGNPPYFREVMLRELSNRIPKRNIEQMKSTSWGSPGAFGLRDYKRQEPVEIIKGLLSVPDERANVSLLESLLGETDAIVHPHIEGVSLPTRKQPLAKHYIKKADRTPGIESGGRSRIGITGKKRHRGKHTN